MIIHHQRSPRLKGDLGDVIPGDRGLARHGVQGGGVDDLLDRCEFRFDLLRRDLELVSASRRQVVAPHPEQPRLETGGFNRRLRFVRGDMAALNENLLLQSDPDGFAGARGVDRFGAPALDRLDHRRLVVRREDQRIAHVQGARFDAARQDAPIVKPVHGLNRESQRLLVQALGGLEAIKRFEDGGTGIPPQQRVVASGDIGAAAGGNRNKEPGFEPDLAQEFRVFGLKLVKDGFRIFDQVHLVDGDHHLPDAEQAQEVTVPAALFAHAFIGGDQQHRAIRAGRAADHILEKFLVTRRVDNDVGPLLRLELDLRGVDGDVLRLLLQKSIQKERILELHPFLATSRLDLLDFPLGQRMGVVKDAPDQGGLAVIDVPDKHDAEPRRGSQIRDFRSRALRESSCDGAPGADWRVGVVIGWRFHGDGRWLKESVGHRN